MFPLLSRAASKVVVVRSIRSAALSTKAGTGIDAGLWGQKARSVPGALPPSVSRQGKLLVGLLNGGEVADYQMAYKDIPGWVHRVFAAVDSDVELREYRLYEGEMPARLDECQHYVFSGSTCSVFQNDPSRPWIARLHRFMQDLLADPRADGPRALGICYGHQLAAYALNDRSGVARNPFGWGVGLRDVVLPREVDMPLWMAPRADVIRMLFSHQDIITHTPKAMSVLGASPHTANSLAVTHNPAGVPKLFSFQGHVECPRSYMHKMYEARTAIIDTSETGRAHRACESLSSTVPSHELLLMRWAINFFRFDFQRTAALSPARAHSATASPLSTRRPLPSELDTWQPGHVSQYHPHTFTFSVDMAQPVSAYSFVGNHLGLPDIRHLEPKPARVQPRRKLSITTPVVAAPLRPLWQPEPSRPDLDRTIVFQHLPPPARASAAMYACAPASDPHLWP